MQVFFISSILPSVTSELKTAYVEDRVAEDNFNATSSSKLFTKAEVPMRDMESGDVVGAMNVYYINFGKDVKNAARMISEILETLAPRSDGWVHTSYNNVDEDEAENNSELAKQQKKAKITRIVSIIATIIVVLIAILSYL